MFSAGALFAQDGIKISGRVLDANGAGVSAATVLLMREGVRFERQAVTDADGSFHFADLTEGTYKISASAQTFATQAQTVRLSAESKNPVDFILQPAQIAAEVLVTSSYLAGTPESLSEIPGSIERIGPQTLENARVFNFSEALRKISGVNVRDEEGFGLRLNIGIRGTNPTRSTKILLLEDGLPLSYA
ncbi:MAG: carboxypeptidase regulatory-like domain-containing protein, partial [Acidobacteriota bacterium]|nr:carboxypeptidase regulatory-like domain-containing protein [Acidobacteriota bacterium]